MESGIKILSHEEVKALREKPRGEAIESVMLALNGFPLNEAQEIVDQAIGLIKAYSPIRLTHSSDL